MSLEFRVSSFESERRRIAGAVSKFLRRAGSRFPRRARDDTPRTVSHLAGSQLETQNSKPETFFDSDFLRKLERLRLVAKRLSWAGAKGEHAVSRKGFSLEFSDYRRYQRGDDLRYVD